MTDIKLKNYKLPKKDIFILYFENENMKTFECMYKYEIPNELLNKTVMEVVEENNYVEVWVN